MSDAMPDERWLPVPGYEGHYLISDRGRVWSVPRTTRDVLGRPHTVRGGLRAIAYDPLGRPLVPLMFCGRQKTHRVASLVAEAFIGPRPEGAVLKHGDDNPDNNWVGNLSYGSAQSNVRESVTNGGHWQASKLTCPLGHLLVAPNLVAFFLKRGERSCLACNRARAALQKKPGQNLQEVAAHRYMQIMVGLDVAALRAELEASLPVPQWHGPHREGIKSRRSAQHSREDSRLTG